MSALDEQALDINRLCFACGQENPIGLRMKVGYEGDEAVCRITLGEHYQGWADITHGGIVATMLDEIMAYAVIHFAGQGLTISMEQKYRKPVPLGRELLLKGRVESISGRRAVSTAEVYLAEGDTLLAEAKARWLMKLGPDGKPEPGMI